MEAGKQIQDDIKGMGRNGRSLMDKSERKLRLKEGEFRKVCKFSSLHSITS